jgi:hypothetical protein
MSLYLCVFCDDEEVEGVELGNYSDVDYFRSTISELLEGSQAGSRYPTLILHSDCDGEWSPSDCARLIGELRAISQAFKDLPAVGFQPGWQEEVAKSLGLKATTLFDCFIDVDGEPLLERMQRLCEIAIEREQPILFQ